MKKKIRVVREYPFDRTILWEWLTVSEKTAQHIGPWVKDPSREGGIFLTMAHEEGQPAMPGRVAEKRTAEHLRLETGEDNDPWVLHIDLEDTTHGSRMIFTHEVEEEMLDMVTIGWEFYADCLTAATEGKPAPRFEDYLPKE